jgi:hypothetical protein
LDLRRFDALCFHYSVRLPYDQISDDVQEKIKNYLGLKVLFIQDEYNNTHRAWYWIKKLQFRIVFTVVPTNNIEKIYPRKEFPHVTFINTLTGFVPEETMVERMLVPPSQRSLVIGYRGRKLPLFYGTLGYEKYKIGQLVKRYCDDNNINCDISTSEEDRIYGAQWTDFLRTCRASLGSESGSNYFDWDGSAESEIARYKKANPYASDSEVYQNLIQPQEFERLMNQISPRIFETIMARSVLVLYEGSYSDIIIPEKHYITLKKNGSNLPEIFELLNNANFVDSMTNQAYEDIIGKGSYSYRSFVNTVDNVLDLHAEESLKCGALADVVIHESVLVERSQEVTTRPLRKLVSYTPEQSIGYQIKWIVKNKIVNFFAPLYRLLPPQIKLFLIKVLRKRLIRA